MPQDRVAEFASLSPIRLLEETERTLDPKLYESHKSIVEQGRELEREEKVVFICTCEKELLGHQKL